jgi:hypothetical protein
VQKLERAKALLSNTNGGLSHEFVLEAALDEFLKDHDPEERKQRREERKHKAEAAGRDPEAGCGQTDGPSFLSDRAGSGQVDGPLFRRRAGDLPTTRAPARGGAPRCVRADGHASRRIPAATRDAVFARDKCRCTYIGANGKRCAATHHLQIDHVIPYARGGTNAIDNLRLLCERHNKKEAERVLGANATRRFRRRE